MKITVLTPDLSHNCLGRAYLLARILQKSNEVEIAGPAFGNGIWLPLRNDRTVRFRVMESWNGSMTWRDMKRLSSSVEGDLIYASKPLMTSFGIGLIRKFSGGKRLVLDIDDWEAGIRRELLQRRKDVRGKLRYLKGSFLDYCNLESILNPYLAESLSFLADGITVSNRFLKRKFGGEIIWHPRDTDFFDPEKYDREEIRRRLGFGNRKVVLFLGTPHPHKGVEDLIRAVSSIPRPEILLALVGVSETVYGKSLARKGNELLGDRFFAIGEQDLEKAPEYLSMSDLVAIPQRMGPATVGQMPMKIFDAMAMAKPIVSTRVSDVPEVLEGCGWVVEPGNPEQLAHAILHILDHPAEAEEQGDKARRKCVAHYSYAAAAETLSPLFSKLC
jgi:glycosyltransferase involved in cell wall biosynthesis